MLALLLALAPVLATPAPAQTPPKPDKEQEAKPKDDRPQLKKDVESISDLVKNRKDDKALLILFEKLKKEFPTSGPKDRRRIADAVGIYVLARHKNVVTMMDHLILTSLGAMGSEGIATIEKLMREEELEDATVTLGSLAYTLVEMNTSASLDSALALLEEKNVRVLQALAKALEQLAKSPGATRKRACAALVAKSENVGKLVEKQAKKKEERSALIAETNGIFLKTLNALSAQSAADLPAWKKYWEERGEKEDWP